ncbi:hypothetical protein WMY93_025142 [Mugilogobius chulae]|uniref:Uncharacterized protein n=1 Tax=Mugilogobius chulae TaxID=88201 RepID=A0AAW0NBK7_9GOBI
MFAPVQCPLVSKGTHVIIPSGEGAAGRSLEAACGQTGRQKLLLSVNSLPTANVGRYQLTAHTVCPNGQAEFKHDPENDIYVLFNPWCEEDTVFMDSEDEKKEYVLSDVGIIYYGEVDAQNHIPYIGYKTWIYGQANGILAVCLYILERSGTQASGWGDPVNVVRIVSAMAGHKKQSGSFFRYWIFMEYNFPAV